MFSRNPTANSNDGMKEPFLPMEDSFPTEESEPISWRQGKRSWGQLFILFPWAIIAVFIVTWLWTSHSSCCNMTSRFDGMVYSPAQHLIEPQNVVFSQGFRPHLSIYQGPSTPERDQAWEDLYSFGIIRIPKSSAARLVNKTVPIPGDPDHYIVQLSVFHQLHCLNMIRLRIWSNNTSISDETLGNEHMSHCIDTLRQAVMCSVDITPLPWRWDPEAKEAKLKTKIVHTCKNFEAVRQWARENHLQSFDPKVHVDDDLNP